MREQIVLAALLHLRRSWLTWRFVGCAGNDDG
jgi:hypothetical protein